tara:strand:- start:145 stop:411 length:267 start_codon:yes stop_codon:yes gene_type:complete
VLGLTANDLRLFDVPEVFEVQVIASDEVSRVPEAPTATNNPLELELEEDELSDSFLSSSLAQEINVRLKSDIRMKYKIFFILFSLAND